MFNNFIDKIVSVLLDAFYLQKIKNGSITNDTNVINVIESFTDNFISKIKKEYKIEVENISSKLSKYFKVYLLHYFYMIVFLKKITTFDEDMKKCKDLFTKKFNKDNIVYYNEKTNSDILKYMTYAYDVLYRISDSKYIFRTSEIPSRWESISDLIINKATNNRIHNLIKIILILFHHVDYREQIFKIIVNNDTKKTKEIEIVVPKQKGIINNSLIEKIFDIENSEKNNLLFEFINNNLNKTIKKADIVKNFNDLVSSNLIYLISDDFLRYHRDNYKYDSEFVNQVNEKSKRRINIAVNNTNKVSKLYNNIDKKDKDDILIAINNRHRKSITVNDVDEIKILKRLYDEGKNKIENEYYEELLKIREIPYISFNKFKHSGITVKLPVSVKLIRYCSFEHIESTSISSDIDNAIQMRNSGKNINCDIVGFCIPSRKSNQFNLNNINLHQEIDIKTVKKVMLDNLSNNLSKTHCFIFKQDLSREFIMNIFDTVYNTITNTIYNTIFNKLQYSNLNNIYNYYNILERYNKTILNINYTPELYTNYINIIYNKLNIQKNYKFDPNQKKKITYNFDTIKTNFKKIQANQSNVCKHRIDWKILNSIDKNSPLYSTLEFEFIKKYAQNIYDGDQIKYITCKSCNELLNVWNYVVDGFYDTNNNFITYYSSKYTDLSQLEEYSQYVHIIEYYTKLMNKLSEFLNLSYHGIKKNKLRDYRIQETLTLLQYTYYNITNNLSNSDKYLEKVKNILFIKETVLSPLDVDLIDVTTFTKPDNEKDQDDKLKINNLISMMLISIIFHINEFDLIFIKLDAKFNINSYNKVKDKLFNRCKIIINNQTKETDSILKYDILCYLIFILTSYIFINNLWYSEYGNRNINTHIQIIHTVIDNINNILELNQSRLDILNNYFSVKNDVLKKSISKTQLIVNSKFLKNLKSNFISKKLYKDIYDNYNKILFNKVDDIANKVSNKYTINDIYHYNKCQIYKSSFNKYKSVQFSKKIVTEFKIEESKLSDDKVDQLYLSYLNILCLYKSSDFCKISKLDSNNKNIIYKNWKDYKSKVDLEKNIDYDKKIKQNENNSSHINSIYKKFEKVNFKDYIFNFCKYIKNILYQKYNINVNIDSDQYSLNFLYTLKKRTVQLFIDNKNIVEIENIIDSSAEKTIYKYDSKSEKVYYFFSKSNLGFIGYQKYSKELTVIDSNVYRHYLVYEKSFYSKIKFLGFNFEENKVDEIKNKDISKLIISQINKIKKYIRNILKYRLIIENDKSLISNADHEYEFLKKYIKEYNISSIKIEDGNKTIFQNWNYIFITDLNKIEHINDYIKNNNFILYYFIHEIYLLLEFNKSKESEVSFYIYDIIDYLIKHDEIKVGDFKQKMAKYFIEIEQITTDKLFRNTIGSDNLKTVNEIINNSSSVDDQPTEIQEEGYDMMDNDNDEDDMMESADN
jgi:hypothetical protein